MEILAQSGREVELAKEIFELEQQAASISAAQKSVKEKFDAKCLELQDYLISEGKSSTGLINGVGVFTIVRKNYPSVTQARMPDFLNYLRQNQDEAIIVETVPAQTLQRYCKDKLETITEALIEDENWGEDIRSQLGVDNGQPPGEVARLYLKQFGIETFSKVNLSHTKKGY